MRPVSTGPGAAGSLVQHRLAVHSEAVKVAPGHPVREEEGLARAEVLHGDGPGSRHKYRRFWRAPSPAPAGTDRFQDDGAGGVTEGKVADRAKRSDAFAIRVEDCNVYRVERRPGHKAHDAKWRGARQRRWSSIRHPGIPMHRMCV